MNQPYIYIYLLFFRFPSHLGHRRTWSSLCHTAGSHQLYILYIVVYISEKAMAPHSSTLAWKIPWVEEPGGLQSMGSLRVRHDWATSLSLSTFMHWRRKWQPHSSVLAWRIPGTGEPDGLLSMGSHRVGHDWSDLAAAAAAAAAGNRRNLDKFYKIISSMVGLCVLIFLNMS